MFFVPYVGFVLHQVLSQATQTQTAVEGVSMNINIPCNLGRQEHAPLWNINGTSYELFDIPLRFSFIPVVDSFTELTIPDVSLELNNTIFQCVLIEPDGNVVYGIINRLIVLPS